MQISIIHPYHPALSACGREKEREREREREREKADSHVCDR